VYLLDAGAGAGYTYFWSTGETTQTILVTASGDYSVTVVNAEGCEKSDTVLVSIIIGTKDAAFSGNLRVFPNPASGWTNLQFTDFPVDTYQVAVHDMTGRLLHAQKINLNSTRFILPVDLTRLPAGAYFIRIASGDQATTRRLIVE
jgi:hypothetical protein